ncbi:unnamed protein product, partial [Mesorhabditis spiculigera]
MLEKWVILLFSILTVLPNTRAETPEDRCLEPVDQGPCQTFQIKWFWDEADGQCKEFHYGGCLGTKNRQI